MQPLIVHATTVAIDGRGVMLTGQAGSGKSSLALQLMAYGAVLVADDRTQLQIDGTALVASCPSNLHGLIEARGLGILRAPVPMPAPVVLVVDMDHRETERLPLQRTVTYLATSVELVLHDPSYHFPAALLQYVRYGRQE